MKCFLFEGYNRLTESSNRTPCKLRSRIFKFAEHAEVAEAARILDTAQNTLLIVDEAGKVPMHKNPANGNRLFRRRDLVKLLAKVAKPTRK